VSEAAPENGPQDEAPAQQPQEGGEQEPKTYDAEYVSNLRKEAAKYRTEAKAKDAELEKQRQASMTEAEKAVAEAETRGRTTALTEFGKELAQTQFDAAAGRRNPGFDTAKALEFVDLAKFLGDDGRPDPKAIAAAVERLVPEPTNAPPSLDGGARATAPKNADMNALLRAGRS
jgi:hypothetical protein